MAAPGAAGGGVGVGIARVAGAGAVEGEAGVAAVGGVVGVGVGGAVGGGAELRELGVAGGGGVVWAFSIPGVWGALLASGFDGKREVGWERWERWVCYGQGSVAFCTLGVAFSLGRLNGHESLRYGSASACLRIYGLLYSRGTGKQSTKGCSV